MMQRVSQYFGCIDHAFLPSPLTNCSLRPSVADKGITGLRITGN
jgi:hypothetical protein